MSDLFHSSSPSTSSPPPPSTLVMVDNASTTFIRWQKRRLTRSNHERLLSPLRYLSLQSCQTRSQTSFSSSPMSVPDCISRWHLLPLIMLCSWFCQPVYGQSHLYFTQVQAPDFTTLHTLLPFIFFIITYPAFVISIFLLWRRRHNYPIAGRGVIYLLATNIILLISSPVLTGLSMVFPDGVPCGLVFLAASFSVLPLSYCYMIRGWILIFRLEISNYLADVRIKEEEIMLTQKNRAIQEEEAKVLKSKNDENGGIAAPQDEDPALSLRQGSNASHASGETLTPLPAHHEDTTRLAVTTTNSVVATTNSTPNTATATATSTGGRHIRQRSEGLRRFRQSEGDLAALANALAHAISSNEHSPVLAPIPIHGQQHITVTRVRAMSEEDGLETISLDQPTTAPETNLNLPNMIPASPTCDTAAGSTTPTTNCTTSPTPPRRSLINTSQLPARSSNTFQPIKEEVSGRMSPNSLVSKFGNNNLVTPIRSSELPNGSNTKYIVVASRASPHEVDSSSTLPSSLPPSELVNLEQIRGHWFIQHRHFIETRWLVAFFFSFTLMIFAVALTFFLIRHDPDVTAINDEMVKYGYWPPNAPPYFTRSQFHPEELFHAAPCVLYNGKMLFLQGCIVGLLLPLGLWIVVKLRQNERRSSEREAEKAKKLAENGVEATSTQPTPKSLAHIRASHPNDTAAVKTELAWIALVAGYICIAYPIFNYFAKPYILFDVLIPLLAIEIITLAHPILIAIRLARAHRAFLKESRQRSLTGPTSSNGHSTTNDTKLPHHRPYYRLRWILRSPVAYPVFLKFLQKEYSSENALFIREVRTFQRLCKSLESRIATWPKPGEDQDQGGANGWVGASQLLAKQNSLQPPSAPASCKVGPRASVTSGQRRTNQASTLIPPSDPVLDGQETTTVVEMVPMPEQPSDALTVLTTGLGLDPMQLDEGGITVPPTETRLSSKRHTPATPATPASPISLPGTVQNTPNPTTRTIRHSHGARLTPHVKDYLDEPYTGSYLTAPTPLLMSQQSTPQGPQPISRPLSIQCSPSPSHHIQSKPAHTPLVTPSQPIQVHLQSPLMTNTSMPTNPTFNFPGHHRKQSSNGASPNNKMMRNLYSFSELTALHEQAREVRAMCLRIHENFLRKGVSFELNIADDLHSLITAQVETVRQWQPSPVGPDGAYLPFSKEETTLPIPPPFALSTLYRQTSMTIFDLVQKDSFRRFILTDEFLDLLFAADEAELRKQQNQESLEAQTRAVMAEAVRTIRVHDEERSLAGEGGSMIVTGNGGKLHGRHDTHGQLSQLDGLHQDGSDSPISSTTGEDQDGPRRSRQASVVGGKHSRTRALQLYPLPTPPISPTMRQSSLQQRPQLPPGETVSQVGLNRGSSDKVPFHPVSSLPNSKRGSLHRVDDDEGDWPSTAGHDDSNEQIVILSTEPFPQAAAILEMVQQQSNFPTPLPPSSAPTTPKSNRSSSSGREIKSRPRRPPAIVTENGWQPPPTLTTPPLEDLLSNPQPSPTAASRINSSPFGTPTIHSRQLSSNKIGRSNDGQVLVLREMPQSSSAQVMSLRRTLQNSQISHSVPGSSMPTPLHAPKISRDLDIDHHELI